MARTRTRCLAATVDPETADDAGTGTAVLDDDAPAPGGDGAAVLPGRQLFIPRGADEAERVLGLETRKLTKAQAAKLESQMNTWKAERHGRPADAMTLGMVDRARKKFGHTAVMLGKDAEAMILTIPAPSLAFEYLIGNDGFPLSLVWQLVAPTGIGKSALLAEFGRWFRLSQGTFVLEEAETKFNEQWYTAIMGREDFHTIPVFRCESIEDWQDKLTFSMNDMKRFMVGTREDPGPGRTFPVLWGVDSIMGKQSIETMDKILGKKGTAGIRDDKGTGHAARDHPLEAMVITRYMRSIPAELDNWPFALVLVNHLRIGKDKQGHDTRTKTGGEQVGFQESFEVELTKEGGAAAKFACAHYEGYRVGLKTFKNSFAPGRRRIVTRLLWWYEDGAVGVEQRAVWDWHWATVHTLDRLRNGDDPHDTLFRERLKAIDFHLKIEERGDIAHRAWSASLGQTADDAMPWDELGRAIQADKPLLAALRHALAITRRYRFKGDYLAQLDAIHARRGGTATAAKPKRKKEKAPA